MYREMYQAKLQPQSASGCWRLLLGIDIKALPSDTFTNLEMHTFTDLVWLGGAVLLFLISYIIFQQPLSRLADDGVSCLIWHMCLLIQSFNSSDHFKYVPRYARVPDFRERRNSSAI